MGAFEEKQLKVLGGSPTKPQKDRKMTLFPCPNISLQIFFSSVNFLFCHLESKRSDKEIEFASSNPYCIHVFISYVMSIH